MQAVPARCAVVPLSHGVGFIATVGFRPPCIAADGHDAVVVERGVRREVVLLDVLHVDAPLHAQTRWEIAPQHIEQFRTVLSIFKVSTPTIQRDCSIMTHRRPTASSVTAAGVYCSSLTHCAVCTSLLELRGEIVRITVGLVDQLLLLYTTWFWCGRGWLLSLIHI